MAKSFFSIKWKLSLAFVLLGLTLVGSYVLIAKDTFESDKISYVFDSQQAQVEAISKDVNQRIEQSLLLTRSILSTYDFTTNSLNTTGEHLFKSQDPIVAIELFDESQKSSIIRVEKRQDLLPASDMSSGDVAKGGLLVTPLSSGVLLLESKEQESDADTLRLRIVVELGEVFPQTNGSQLFVLSQAGKPILASNDSGPLPTEAIQIISDLSRDRSPQGTLVRELEDRKYLISTVKLKFGDLRLMSLVNQEEALGALKILFRRSIIFILFSGFATILISLVLSKGLTGNLQLLAHAAKRIGQGHFSDPIRLKSNDEVGVLSSAFEAMGGEIERLLTETKDKARMEEELKTASLVQESLFPKQRHYQSGSLAISGVYATSSECGGDWWYYFDRGDEIIIVIADATGHGTPAALITAAARSLFSKLERSSLSLLEMARDWDTAVSASSGQKVFMTAFLLRLNKDSGQGSFLNACHEPPLHLRNADGGIEADFLNVHLGSTLGELHSDRFKEEPFHLDRGEALVLFTDGVTAVENPEGKTISDARFAKAVQKIVVASRTAPEIASGIHDYIEKHRKGTPLPDDVTLVVVKHI